MIRDNKVDYLTSRNQDFHQRRVTNAAPSQDPNDYIIQKELTDNISTVQSKINVLNENLVKLKEQVQVINDQIIEINADIAALTTEVEGFEDAITALNSDLTIAHRHVKVGATGGSLAQSTAVADDGNLFTAIIPFRVNPGSTDHRDQIDLKANNAGNIGLLCSGADAEQILFDCEFDGGSYIARHNTACVVQKSGNYFRVDYANGLTPGSGFFPGTFAFGVDLVNNRIVMNQLFKINYIGPNLYLKTNASGDISGSAT